MRRLLVLLFVLLVSFHFCWADVVFTDQEYQELTEIMDHLEILNNEQQKTIDSLRMQNEELQIQSENKQKILDEQNQTLKQQEISLKEEKRSSLITTLISNLITLVISFITGAFVW